MGFINGTVSSNAKLMDLIDVVKPIVREAVENVNKVQYSHFLLRFPMVPVRVSALTYVTLTTLENSAEIAVTR